MELLTSLIFVLLGSLSAFLGGFIIARYNNVRIKKLVQSRNEYEELYRGKFQKEFEKQRSSLLSEFYWGAQELVDENVSATVLNTVTIPYISKEEVDKQIDEKVGSLVQRIVEIEQRFPGQDTVDKIASVNDAILATQIENLTETVKRIEDKILSRWDIAKIVFQVLGTIGLIVSLVMAIITFI